MNSVLNRSHKMFFYMFFFKRLCKTCDPRGMTNFDCGLNKLVGVCNCSMFCCTLLYVHFSIAIILMGKRELIALLNLSSWCPVMVERLFLTVPRGCLQFVIVVFPDHTHLLFFTERCYISDIKVVGLILQRHFLQTRNYLIVFIILTCVKKVISGLTIFAQGP